MAKNKKAKGNKPDPFEAHTSEELNDVLNGKTTAAELDARKGFGVELLASEIKALVEKLENEPPESRVDVAYEFGIFRKLGLLDSLRRTQWVTALRTILDVKKKDIEQAIKSAEMVDDKEDKYEPSPEVLKLGEEFARELGEDVLERAVETVHALGVENEDQIIKLAVLTMNTRFLERPVCAVIKGVSSGGKSWSIEHVIRLFPEIAYFKRTGTSPRALAYTDEDLRHRVLVLYELAGIDSREGMYFLRTLQSEGHIIYETVESTSEGLKPRVIIKEGPTGYLVTTTKPKLHPENETRLISININDTSEQTKNINIAQGKKATGERREELDLSKWQAYHEWLAFQNSQVIIPYALALANLIPPVAVRLRRDFSTLLSLIEAHAILCQLYREKDAYGRIIATYHDYAAVQEVAADLISVQTGKGVRRTIRETVAATQELIDEGKPYVTIKDLMSRLGLCKSTVADRVKSATSERYLIDKAGGGPGKQKELVTGDPLPDDDDVLPSVKKLIEATEGTPTGNLSELPEFPAQDTYLMPDTASDGSDFRQKEDTPEFQDKIRGKKARLSGKTGNPGEKGRGTPYHDREDPQGELFPDEKEVVEIW